MLLGVDVGGTFTDAVLAVGGRLVTAKAPTTPEDQSEGVLNAVTAVLERAGERREGRRGVRARHDRGHQRAARGRGSEDRVRRHGGLRGHRRARPPGARRPLPAVRAAPRAARAARAPGRRQGAHDPRRARARAGRRRRRRGDHGARARVRRGLPAARLPPPRARAGARGGARRAPDVHVSLSHEVVGTFREYERAATTELDAALSPLLAAYLRNLTQRAQRRRAPGAVGDAVQRRARRASTRPPTTPC